MILEAVKKRLKQDKFPVRMPQELHTSILDLSLKHERSLNSEICYALDQWHREHSETNLICRILNVGQSTSYAIEATELLDHVLLSKKGIRHFMIRFNEDQLQTVRDYSYSEDCSMNVHVNVVLTWWVSVQQELIRKLASLANVRP